MVMTREELDRLRALCAAATPETLREFIAAAEAALPELLERETPRMVEYRHYKTRSFKTGWKTGTLALCPRCGHLQAHMKDDLNRYCPHCGQRLAYPEDEADEI